MTYKRIDVENCHQLLQKNDVIILDIRDKFSFSQGHMPSAQHIEDINMSHFQSTTDKNKTLLICCYHGISSQSAANYFSQQGFQHVYSLDGGYEAWEQHDAKHDARPS